ncbi:hypothetical protein AMAG_13549 [Allomyces macrogynus ATCC 38327]|uniref:F-box domain-containing protein n=1 Tax=Allomyces macrogynus (strain ATCC 38327) TaxID=578462 RepID=A0A0L0T225_ALLM3|nr:hypothetical protein AMAG_13549 [Allomyces macrogynus ATCC 38327]|eukprot:KNE68913.1 hypothetical protein AMAG_13549 [Allomyces macrogynus ATCC 38327]
MSATPPPMLPPPRTATTVSPPPMTLSTAMALRTPSPGPMAAAATTAWSLSSRSPTATVLARAAPRTAGAAATGATSASTAVAPSVCYRHRPDVRAKEPRVDLDALLQQLPAPAQTQVAQMWTTFAASSSRLRETILLGLLDACCMPQLTVVSRAIAPVMKMDLISQLPMELALRVLQYLDAKSLCRAAQVSKAWARLANDDVLWHRMCLQHIDKRCAKCGWGLPMLSRKRKRTRCSSDSSTTGVAPAASSSGAPGPSSAASGDGKGDVRPALTSSSTSLSRVPAAPTSCGGQMPIVSTIPVSALLNPPSSDDNDDSDDDDDAMRACLDQPPLKRVKRSGSVAPGSIHGSSAAVPERQGMTRHVNGPTDTAVNALHRNRRRNWKAVYAERLIIERNWRRNSHLVFPLVPPTASLQPRITACHLDEPFLMTSSMDGLVRLWNLETRTCVQTLAGHRGAVTGVHFDEANGTRVVGRARRDRAH